MRRLALRMQLTLLYAATFFVCGALLLTIPLVGARHTVPVDSPPGARSPVGPDAEVSGVVTASAAGLAVTVLVSLGLGWLIAGRFVRPLREITAAARDISASNLHRRLGRTGHNDEFTELAQTLDDLFERLEASFESQRHFVANASHELRTPLTAERALLQVALADPDATVASLRAACKDVLALGEAQERLIGSLLTLASGEQGVGHREPFDLAAIAAAAITSRHGEAQRRTVRVATALAPARSTGDPKLVESLVANLVDNALRHNVPGGWVEIETTTVDGGAGITVTNTGPPVPPGEVARLFQPFQRLGGQRLGHTDGHGLGLAIIRAITSGHGATLVAHARPEGGLRIEIRFPGHPALPQSGS